MRGLWQNIQTTGQPQTPQVWAMVVEVRGKVSCREPPATSQKFRISSPLTRPTSNSNYQSIVRAVTEHLQYDCKDLNKLPIFIFKIRKIILYIKKTCFPTALLC
uniref:Uncharacterized protein n=1 Tax=Cacopsylla melanoneura TaxID=428564 RepID=A0A8D8RUA1_9HEMI